MKSYSKGKIAQIVFGSGSSKSLVNRVQGFNAKRCLIVSDSRMIDHELTKNAMSALKESNIEFDVYSEVNSEPTDEMCLYIGKQIKEQMYDCVIGIGKEVIDFCKDAKEYGVNVLNISRGNIITTVTLYEVAPVDIKNGFNVEDGERIRKETGMFTMPCGRINTPEFAEKILEDDKADLIVMARAQLADANFCNKAKNGQVNQIRYCSNSLYDPSIKHIT